MNSGSAYCAVGVRTAVNIQGKDSHFLPPVSSQRCSRESLWHSSPSSPANMFPLATGCSRAGPRLFTELHRPCSRRSGASQQHWSHFRCGKVSPNPNSFIHNQHFLSRVLLLQIVRSPLCGGSSCAWTGRAGRDTKAVLRVVVSAGWFTEKHDDQTPCAGDSPSGWSVTRCAAASRRVASLLRVQEFDSADSSDRLTAAPSTSEPSRTRTSFQTRSYFR